MSIRLQKIICKNNNYILNENAIEPNATFVRKVKN